MIRIVGLEIKRTWQEYGILTQYIRKHSLQYLITTYLSPFFSISVVFLIGYIVVIRSIHAQTNNQAQAILADNSLLLSKADYFDELTRHFAQSKRDVRLIEDVPILGTPDARVTVLAFSDFQCPYCQLAALQVKKILSEYRDNIKLYFIHYPLDPSINSNISSKGHLYAGLAARASMYAYDRGKFWEFHDDLFELQPTLSKETVFSLTNKYGWNRDQFEIAIESPIIINRVKKHIQWGQEIGIKVTPSLFINGRQVINWQDSLLLRQIINKELQISNFQ